MSILKFTKWLFIFSPIIFLFSLRSGDFGIIEWICGEIFFIFISFCLIYFVVGKDSKCNHCKKPFALKKTNQEIISKEDVSVLVETKTRNRNRDIVGTTEQYVPGVRTTYKVAYVCRHCGNITYRTYSKSEPTL